jgi:thiol-disulfide isomerase/thioredoxin
MRSKLLALLSIWGLLAGAPARSVELHTGQIAPDLTFRTLEGVTVDTRELKHKVVILAFWATWCPPCRDELPLLSEYAKAHAGEGLVVLGLSLDQPSDLAQVKAVANGLSFPVGLLGSQWTAGYGRIWRLPVSFVIDRQGRLAENGWDERTPIWSKDRLDQVILPLLAR